MYQNGIFDWPVISSEVLPNPNAGQFLSFTTYTDRPSFEAATANRVEEDFENNLVADGLVVGCTSNPTNSTTTDLCFNAGSIIPGVDFGASEPLNLMVVLGVGTILGPTGDTFGPSTFVDEYIINNLGAGVVGIAFEVVELIQGQGVTITVEDNTAATSVTPLPGVADAPTFFGITSTNDITSITIEGNNGGGELLQSFTLARTLLPVELVNFDAVSEASRINLTWSTASENNNAGFSIELSADGNNFVDREWVAGSGSTTEAQSYSYDLEGIIHGKQYVRLKQVDFDGSFEYSHILEVTTEIPDRFDLQSAYPNPFNPSTRIQFSVAESIPVRLAIYDAMGNLLAVPYSGVAPVAELQSIEFDGSELPSGTYFYQLATRFGTKSKAFTLLK